MRKFTIHTLKGTMSIMEVECETITPMDDPSVLWSLKDGEYKARVTAPKSLYEKDAFKVDEKGKPLLVEPVWCWHAFYDTLEAAKGKAMHLITEEFERALRKHGTEYTLEDIAAKAQTVQVVLL